MASTQIIIFELEKQLFGVKIDCIRGINKIKEFNIVNIPTSPTFIEGMITLRGEIISLYNLRKRFLFENDSIGQNDELIIAKINNVMIGLIVDEVIDIVKIQDENFENTDQLFFTNATNKFISNIAKKDDDMIIILDLEKILTIEENDFCLKLCK